MIRYVHADATIALSEKAVICHINNNLGVAGAGFVVPLYQRYPKAGQAYKDWHKERKGFELGEIQTVWENGVYVVNMIAQNGIGTGKRQVDYDALNSCLEKLHQFMKSENLTKVQMPRIGAGLGGGDWNVIESIIRKTLSDKGIDVTVCDFN